MTRFNEIQTELTEELLIGLDKGVIAELEEILDSVLFVYNLANANRKKIIDTPHDEEGKVIVDLTNPHILEDMDYFRQPAIHFQRHNNYSFLAPNPSPTSDYFKFWKEETRRCREGLIRKYDGEWIPGSFYYYLNYSPILKSKAIGNTKAGDRDLGFPDMYDGDYIFYHYIDQARKEGEHAGLLKKRGAGFSYKMGADLGRILKVGYNSKTKERVVAFAIASETEYLMKDGILSKFMSNVAWTDHYTPWPRLKLSESKANMTWKMGYKTKDGQIEGTENEIIGVTTKGDPDKARGKRGPVYWEEWGKFPNLLKSWEVAKQSVQEGDVTFFTMIGGGTGGTVGANFQGAEELFYNCLGYNIRGIPNVFDKNMKGESNCGLFWGAYLNRLRCYDENGNSNVIKALIEILNMRAKIRSNSTDPNTLVQHKAEMPITPQEAIMRREGSIFPVVDLKDHLAQISPSLQKFVSSHYVGHLKYGMNGKAEWDKLQLHPVLRDYPLKRDALDVYGCLEIYQMPKRRQDGTVQWGRYIAGIDPIDYDISTYSHSMGSIFIFDLLLDRIVAEYTGRPPRATEFYEQALRLLKFYNAEASYENNLKGLFSFFEQKKAMHYLCDTPQILKDMELVKGQLYGNRSKGINASKTINAWGRKLQADWMISDAYDIDNIDEHDEEGNLIEKAKVLNLQKIRSIAYLKEAIAWNPDDNFDRCLLPGSKVKIEKGVIAIEDIKVQDKVLTRSGELNKVCEIHKNNYKGNIISIRPLGQFNTLSCTSNHPILIRRYDKKPQGKNWYKLKANLPDAKFINAEDVKKKDYILFPKRNSLLKTKFSNDLLYLMGWYISDGWCSKISNQIRIFFQGDQYEIAKDVCNIINKYYKHNKTWVLPRTDKNGRHIKGYWTHENSKARIRKDKDSKNMWVVEIFSRELKELLQKHCGIAHNKKMSSELYNSSGLLPFIKGYFEGDGHYRCDVRNDGVKRASLEVASVYRELIFQIRQILIDEGVWNTVRLHAYSKKKPNLQDQYIITITGRNCIKIIKGSKKFNQKNGNKQGKINRYDRKVYKESYIEDKEGFWIPVSNIKIQQYQGKVYNISVEKDETYVAENILTHNCSAMGMLMILREDKLKFERRQLQEDHSQLLKDPWFNRFGGFTAPNKKLSYIKSKYSIKF